MITIKIAVIMAMVFISATNSQNITNKLGTNGKFIVSDVTSIPQYFMVDKSLGCVGIGTNVFDTENPEKLLIDCGVTNSVNAVYTKGTINSYFQINIRNLSPGNQSSSDIVCTANNGTETTYFMNMGINGSGFLYQNGNPIETGKANDCYVISSGNDLYIVNNNASKDMLFLTGGTSANNERFRIRSNGKIGIGVSNPNNLLTLSGGAYSNGTSWSTSSDSTLKYNIADLTKYGLAEILKIRSVSYIYKSDSTGRLEIGFVAQELKNIIPEIVSGEEGSMGISYGNLVPVLVNAVKEQQQQIDIQRSDIDRMKSEISEIKTMLNNREAGATGDETGILKMLLYFLAAGTVLTVATKLKKKQVKQ